jgi:hypothetical protein
MYKTTEKGLKSCNENKRNEQVLRTEVSHTLFMSYNGNATSPTTQVLIQLPIQKRTMLIFIKSITDAAHIKKYLKKQNYFNSIYFDIVCKYNLQCSIL